MYRNVTQKRQKKALRNTGVRRWRTVPPPVDLGAAKVLQIRIVPRNRLLPGTVVWVRMPFQEIDDHKIRPAVVVHCRGRVVTLLPCTTSDVRHRLGRHIELKHLAQAGVFRPTGVDRRSAALDYLEILNIIGELSEEDLAAVLPTARRHAAAVPAQRAHDSAA